MYLLFALECHFLGESKKGSVASRFGRVIMLDIVRSITLHAFSPIIYDPFHYIFFALPEKNPLHTLEQTPHTPAQP